MSFEFDRGGFRFPQDDERERNDRFREDIGSNPFGRILAPILQSILPGAQEAIYPPVYPQDQYGQGNYQQTADQIATSMRMGDAQQAANLLQNELSTNPNEAQSVIALAQQETQFNSRDRLVTGQDGSLQIQDTYTGQTTFAGWLPNNVAGNYGNDGNQWQNQNGDQNYWTSNGTNNLQPYLNPGYSTDYGYANNGYNNYNQFNPAQTALDLTFGTIGGLALGSLFHNSGQNYGYRPGYAQQQWQPTQQYTGQNTAQQYQPTQQYTGQNTAQQYQPTQTYMPTTTGHRQHSTNTAQQYQPTQTYRPTNTAQQYQPTQTYRPTNTAQQYQPTQTYPPTNTGHPVRQHSSTNTAQQYQPSQSYTAAINTAQQYHPNPHSSTTTAAQQYHPTMQYKPTINTAQTQPMHQWTPAAVSHPAPVARPVAEVSHPVRPATPAPSPHAVVAAKPAANQPKHA